jgi:very-short-patch-repair endonuclease
MGMKWRSRPGVVGEQPLDHGPLARLAARQHGVVSIRQLEGPLGYSQPAIARAVRNRRLHRIHQGVYAVGHTNLTRHGCCLAAVLGAGPEALLSHRSAGWLWDIARSPPAPYEVTAPIPRRRKPPLVVHYARHLRPEDRAIVDGIPATAVPRTLLDLAASIPIRRLDRCLERAEERRLFDLTAVEALLGRTVGHPGHGRLRRAIALYREPAFTRSELERRFLEHLLEAGLPRPSTGFNVAGYELDFYWPRERFAVELDTFRTHGSRLAFERDRLRQEELKLAGVEMIRVTGRRLEREPQRVAERVAQLLERRRIGGGRAGA